MGLSSQYKVADRNPALRSLLQAQEGMKRKNNGHRAPTRWYVRQACESHPWHFCVFLRQECPPSPSPPVFSSRSQEKASHASDDSLLPLSVHHYWQEWRGDPGALCTPSWTSRCPHLITHSLTTTLCPVIISALLLPCIYIYQSPQEPLNSRLGFILRTLIPAQLYGQWGNTHLICHLLPSYLASFFFIALVMTGNNVF